MSAHLLDLESAWPAISFSGHSFSSCSWLGQSWCVQSIFWECNSANLPPPTHPQPPSTPVYLSSRQFYSKSLTLQTPCGYLHTSAPAIAQDTCYSASLRLPASSSHQCRARPTAEGGLEWALTATCAGTYLKSCWFLAWASPGTTRWSLGCSEY